MSDWTKPDDEFPGENRKVDLWVTRPSASHPVTFSLIAEYVPDMGWYDLCQEDYLLDAYEPLAWRYIDKPEWIK